MLQLLITVGRETRDYTRYWDSKSSMIDERINIPFQLQLTLTPIDAAFVIPSLRAYVQIYSTRWERSLFTGFVSSEPVRELKGTAHYAMETGGQLFSYKLTVTSEDHLLNIKAVPFLPAYVNRTQGQILTDLAEVLCPGFFDTSAIASGDVVPRFEYDPQMSWSEVAKKMGDGSRHRYTVRDRKITYQPYGDAPLGIEYDERKPRSSFDAKALRTDILAVPSVNDVTIIGDVEAGTAREDYFIGDGFTGNFPLKHKVFRGASSVLLQETWQSGSLNAQQWYMDDPGGNFDFSAGALNVITLAAGEFSDLGTSYLMMNNGLELAGGINLQHGEVAFNDYCDGVIGGLYEDSELSTMLGGFVVTSPTGVVTSASGAAGVYIQPTWNGAPVGDPIVSEVNHTYVLQTVITAPAYSRYKQVYRTREGEIYGGGVDTVRGSVRMSVSSYNIAAATGFYYVPDVTTVTITDVELPAFAAYALIDQKRLHLTLDNTIVAIMPLGSLSAQVGPSGLYSPTGAILPMLSSAGYEYHGAVMDWPGATGQVVLMAPGGLNADFEPQVLGNGFNNEVAQITAGNEADTLAFYAQTVPAAGTPVKFQSWEAQAAISRVQDGRSVADEAFIVGDDGIRSCIVTDLNPLPRTSEDCDNAAKAFIADRVGTFYNGSYKCTSAFFEPLTTDEQFWPAPGRFFHVHAPHRKIDDQNFLVTGVKIRFLDLATEMLEFELTFGADLHLEKVLKNFVDLQPPGVLAPQDKATPPNPRSLEELDTDYLPDIAQLTITSIDTERVQISAVTPLTYTIEVRTQDLHWGRRNTVSFIDSFQGVQAFPLQRKNFDQTWYFRLVEFPPRVWIGDLHSIAEGAIPGQKTLLQVPIAGLESKSVGTSEQVNLGGFSGGWEVLNGLRQAKYLRKTSKYMFMEISVDTTEVTSPLIRTSRRSKAIHVAYPLRPAPPKMITSTAPSINYEGAVQFDFNGDVRSIYGLEVQANDGKIIYQRPVLSYADMNVELSATPYSLLSEAAKSKLSARFFNHYWAYSAPIEFVMTPWGAFLFGEPTAPSDVSIAVVAVSGSAERFGYHVAWTPHIPVIGTTMYEVQVRYFHDPYLNQPDTDWMGLGTIHGPATPSGDFGYWQRPVVDQWVKARVRGVTPAGDISDWAESAEADKINNSPTSPVVMPPALADDEWTVEIGDYGYDDINHKAIVMLKATVLVNPAEVKYFSIYSFESPTEPSPADPASFKDVCNTQKALSGNTELLWWIDQGRTERIFQLVCVPSTPTWTGFVEEDSNMKSLTVPPIGPAANVTGFTAQLMTMNRGGVPCGHYKFGWTNPTDLAYWTNHIFFQQCDASWSPLPGAQWVDYFNREEGFEQTDWFPLPSETAYFLCKTQSETRAHIFNTAAIAGQPVHVTVTASTGLTGIDPVAPLSPTVQVDLFDAEFGYTIAWQVPAAPGGNASYEVQVRYFHDPYLNQPDTDWMGLGSAKGGDANSIKFGKWPRPVVDQWVKVRVRALNAGNQVTDWVEGALADKLDHSPTTGVFIPPALADNEWSAEVVEYASDTMGKPVAHLKATVTSRPANVKYFSVYSYEGAAPPSPFDESLFTDVCNTPMAASGNTELHWWVDRSLTATRTFQLIGVCSTNTYTDFPGAEDPIKEIEVAPVAVPAQVTGFNCEVISMDQAGIPVCHYRFTWTKPVDLEYWTNHVLFQQCDASWNPLPGAQWVDYFNREEGFEQSDWFVRPESTAYFLCKTQSESRAHKFNTTVPAGQPVHVTLTGSDGMDISKARTSSLGAGLKIIGNKLAAAPDDPNGPSGATIAVNNFGAMYGLQVSWTPPGTAGGTTKYEVQHRFYHDAALTTPDTDWMGLGTVMGASTATAAFGGSWPRPPADQWVVARVRGVNSGDSYSGWATTVAAAKLDHTTAVATIDVPPQLAAGEWSATIAEYGSDNMGKPMVRVEVTVTANPSSVTKFIVWGVQTAGTPVLSSYQVKVEITKAASGSSVGSFWVDRDATSTKTWKLVCIATAVSYGRVPTLTDDVKSIDVIPASAPAQVTGFSVSIVSGPTGAHLKFNWTKPSPIGEYWTNKIYRQWCSDATFTPVPGVAPDLVGVSPDPYEQTGEFAYPGTTQYQTFFCVAVSRAGKENVTNSPTSNLTLSPQITDSSNVIGTNYSFDYGYDGWKSYHDGTPGHPAAEGWTIDTQGGAKCAKISGSDKGIEKDGIPTRAGDQWVLKCRAKIQAGSIGAVILVIHWLDATGTLLTYSSHVVTATSISSSSFQQLATPVWTAPAGTASMRVYPLYTDSTFSGVIWCDDALLTRASASDLLPSGGDVVFDPDQNKALIAAAKVTLAKISPGTMNSTIFQDYGISNATKLSDGIMSRVALFTDGVLSRSALFGSGVILTAAIGDEQVTTSKIHDLSVNKLTAGSAIFTGDVVFQRGIGGPAVIISSGAVAIVNGTKQVYIDSSAVVIAGNNSSLSLDSTGITLRGPGGVNYTTIQQNWTVFGGDPGTPVVYESGKTIIAADRVITRILQGQHRSADGSSGYSGWINTNSWPTLVVKDGLIVGYS